MRPRRPETLERETAGRERDKATRERDRLAVEAQRRRQEAARADARRSARNVGKHDSGARARIRLAVLTGQDGKVPALSSRMAARLARAEASAAAVFVEKVRDGGIWVDTLPCGRKVLARVVAPGTADRGFAPSVVARLNSNPARVLEGGRASPGEVRK